jgi:hypothetical protein
VAGPQGVAGPAGPQGIPGPQNLYIQAAEPVVGAENIAWIKTGVDPPELWVFEP